MQIDTLTREEFDQRLAEATESILQERLTLQAENDQLRELVARCSETLERREAALAQSQNSFLPAHFDLKGFSVELTRLHDENYHELRGRSLAIKDDFFFLMGLLYPAEEENVRRLNLAEVRFILEHRYGKSGRMYDDYKGSFSFPFTLDVIKGDRRFPYLLNVCDFRGGIEFRVRKLVENESQADDYIHPPYEEEFSREEINYFVAYFYGFLIGALASYRKTATNPPDPFLFRVQSNLVLYGFHEDNFFEKEFDSEEEFEKAIGVLTV